MRPHTLLYVSWVQSSTIVDTVNVYDHPERGRGRSVSCGPSIDTGHTRRRLLINKDSRSADRYNRCRIFGRRWRSKPSHWMLGVFWYLPLMWMRTIWYSARRSDSGDVGTTLHVSGDWRSILSPHCQISSYRWLQREINHALYELRRLSKLERIGNQFLS